MSAIIYLITNTINHKQYIGQTSRSLEWRWSRHCYEATRGSRYHFHSAIRKHGPDVFDLEVLEETTDELVNDREQYWITELAPAYNSTSGGDNGFTMTEDVKDKIRNANKGRPKSAEWRAAISAQMRQRWQNPDYRKRTTSAMKGVKRSEETCARVSASKRGVNHPNYGKSHSLETRVKIAESNRRTKSAH